VVIPVKDDARFLETCLRALAGQTTAPFEVIVVDNGSTDDSAGVAQRHGATVLREDEPGIAAAASRGYDHASGDIIARLDADSVAPAGWIGLLMGAFQRHLEVDAFTGSAAFTDGPDAWRQTAARIYLGAYFVSASSALSHPPLFGSNFAMRAPAWRAVRAEVHRSDVTIHDDFDLSFHLGRTHRIRYLSSLRLGISMRPLLDGGGLVRMTRGFRTVVIHWPHDLPWLRLARILIRRQQGQQRKRQRQRRQRQAPSTAGGRRSRFRAVLVLDGLNVGLLAASAALTTARERTVGPRAPNHVTAVPAVALVAWLFAVVADRYVRAPASDLEHATRADRRAREMVWVGLVVNTAGSVVAAERAGRRGSGRRVGFARALYLLAGGLVVSIAYLRALDR